MSADKRYYWVKLDYRRFEHDGDLDYLMGQKDGAQYVVLYMMLCLQTRNSGGEFITRLGDVIIPYDVDRIVRDCKYFSRDTVMIALELYKQLGLIYVNDGGFLQISNFENVVGSESQSAKWMRDKRERDKQKQITSDITTTSLCDSHCEADVRQDIRYKRKEIRDIDNSLHSLSNLCQNPEDSDVREASFPAGNNKNSSLTEGSKTDTEMLSETKKESFPSRIYQDVVDRYNRTCTSLPRCTVISDKRKKIIKACWKEYGEKIYEAFEKAEASDFLSGRSGDWNGCGFDWLMNRNNMLKVLENNYGNNSRKKKNPVDDIMPYRFSNEEFHRQMEEIEKDPRYKGDGDITFMF